ncbi:MULTISPECIES: DUF443 family protein [Lacticaseibacillus]|uniref:DUF443 family protein n=2 Tax=Lacticaseibacillus TaxID=2759736 RepID=A0AAN1KEY1_LACCA|nr:MULTISPECIES: DUF443 family protein [Lacticaseibacillus]ARY92229.1 hypothetical protein BGL52_10880 [Lacticaseibacillus casei]KAB1971280.1 DUF443 family protein [Lacticaseibacillus casei]WLV80136.1 DUF443 family protein [Lacticaseibacillus sp. NCIMB 15473]WNX24095.1 DUF443 family protein [Lacticaseibacillus casei]WNX26869.1 DUF443 family protein [Lacticaseibacillus casei]
MTTIQFRPIYKYFRYEMGVASDGNHYLIDMGNPFMAWFFYPYSFIAPMCCYLISDEVARNLSHQKRSAPTSVALAGGVGVLVSSVIRHTDNSFGVTMSLGNKLFLIVLIIGVLIASRLYAMNKAKKFVMEIGAELNSGNEKMIHLRPNEVKAFFTISFLMLAMATILSINTFIVLQPQVNILFFLIFAITFFIYIYLSSLALLPAYSFTIYFSHKK